MQDSQAKIYLSPINKDLMHTSISYGDIFNFNSVHHNEIKQGITIPEFSYKDFLQFDDFKGKHRTCQTIYCIVCLNISNSLLLIIKL